MANSKIEVVTGVKNETLEYVSPHDCLVHLGPSFYTTQNAIRIHEWMGSSEAVPLLLEKVGSDELLELGNMTTEESTYTKSTPMAVHRAIAAKPVLDALVRDGKLSDILAQEVGDTQQPITYLFRELCSLNLFALAGGYELSIRSHFKSVQCLDFMVSAIRRSRDVQIYVPRKVIVKTPGISMTDNMPTDGLVGVITTMEVEGNWLQFEMAADAIMGGQYFKEACQFLMAYSAVHETPMPKHLIAEEGPFFAEAYLNFMRIRDRHTPKASNVVNIFGKN